MTTDSVLAATDRLPDGEGTPRSESIVRPPATLSVSNWLSVSYSISSETGEVWARVRKHSRQGLPPEAGA